jgi:cold-inducible RNA-binding protein
MGDRERSRSPDQNAGNGSGGGGDAGGEEVKLYVGNLDYATDEAKLREEFSQFGSVTDVFLPIEKATNRPRGFGFVTFSKRSDAENAIGKMDQAQVDGRTIRVNESRPRGSAAPRGAGGSGFNASGAKDVSLFKCICCVPARSAFWRFLMCLSACFSELASSMHLARVIQINRSNST